ncbi:MAG TPA: serine/threonine-protein kinase [Microthrixaceae bacterium]|nr:serine/threonine-protein kinase [Microthrixaceae bacterium]
MSAGGSRPIRSSGLPTRVRLVERVGMGTFGEVWLARDTRDGIDVAVKFLVNDRQSDVDSGRFEREVRSLARVADVPGIVSIRDLGVAPDGTPWLITEFLPGGTLRFRLDLEAPAPFSAEAIALIGQLLPPLASSLAGAHAVGVAHGDISPTNILFDAHGQPWLSDFGMAALRKSGLASDGVGGLTPAYAAPERLRGAIPDARSDVYSLAATLWHALSGDPKLSGAPKFRGSIVGGEQGVASNPAAEIHAGVEPSGDGTPSVDIRMANNLVANNLVVDVLAGALDPAPGRRPSAAEIVEALNPRKSTGRWWRYRRRHGKR